MEPCLPWHISSFTWSRISYRFEEGWEQTEPLPTDHKTSSARRYGPVSRWGNWGARASPPGHTTGEVRQGRGPSPVPAVGPGSSTRDEHRGYRSLSETTSPTSLLNWTRNPGKRWCIWLAETLKWFSEGCSAHPRVRTAVYPPL